MGRRGQALTVSTGTAFHGTGWRNISTAPGWWRTDVIRMCLRASGELPLADVVRNGEGEEAQRRGELLQGFLAPQAVSQVSLVFLVLGRGQRSEDVAGVDAAQPGFGWRRRWI